MIEWAPMKCRRHVHQDRSKGDLPVEDDKIRRIRRRSPFHRRSGRPSIDHCVIDCCLFALELESAH